MALKIATNTGALHAYSGYASLLPESNRKPTCAARQLIYFTSAAKPPVLPAALSDSIQTAAEQSDLSTEQQLKDVLFQLFSSPDTLATSFALPAGQLSHQQACKPFGSLCCPCHRYEEDKETNQSVN